MNAYSDAPSYATAQIVEESGRWVVYLIVTYWTYEDEPELERVRHRIDAFTTRRQAEITAEWVTRSANRDLYEPPSGL